MKNIINIASVAGLLSLGAGAATPARAIEGLAFSGAASVVSDYRGRGITSSDEDPALQGAADVAHEASGLSAGIFASSMDDSADAEIDLYAAKSFAVGETEISFGGTAYFFPGADDSSYGEALLNVAHAIGPTDINIGVNYAWAQQNLDDDDNTYVYANFAAPVGEFAGVTFTLNGAIGHEKGPIAVEDEKRDWSLGIAAEFRGFEFALSYVDTDLEEAPPEEPEDGVDQEPHNPVGKGAAVFSISRSF